MPVGPQDTAAMVDGRIVGVDERDSSPWPMARSVARNSGPSRAGMPISMVRPLCGAAGADQEAFRQRQAGAAERARMNADRALAHSRDAEPLDVDLPQRLA